MKAKETPKWYDHLFRFGVLALAGVLMFAGVQSLITADPVVRYTTAAVIVVFIVRELV